MIDLWILVAFCVAAAGAAVFVVRYHVRTGGAWKRHPWGRHVMLFTVGLLCMEVQPVLFRLFGDWPGRLEVLLFLAVALAVAQWHRVVLNELDLQPRRKAGNDD